MVLLEIPNAADRRILAPLSMSFTGIYSLNNIFTCFLQLTLAFVLTCWQLSCISYFIVCRANPAKISSEYKPANQLKCSAVFSWRYIYLSGDIFYYSKLSVVDPWERTVHCLFCNSLATLKPTKTIRIMLWCNTCGVLVFANGLLSQQRIQKLRDFIFTHIYAN